PARLPAQRKALADDSPGKLCRSLARRNVECRKQQRREKTVINRTGATDDVADRLVTIRPYQPRHRQIVDNRRLRHPAIFVEKPPWKSAVAETQRPLFLALQVDE